jgi:hypothetical protein
MMYDGSMTLTPEDNIRIKIEQALVTQFGPIRTVSTDRTANNTILYVTYKIVNTPASATAAQTFVDSLEATVRETHLVDLTYTAASHYVDCRIEL